MGGHENMITRRGQLKASITRFSNYLQSQNTDWTEVMVRREQIEDVWTEYEQVQSAIEMEEGSNIETQNKYRAEFEDLYFKTIAIAGKIIIAAGWVVSQDENTNKNTNTDIPNVCMNKVLSSIKLSSLSVPVFTGNYQEWASFYDIFSALINNNASLMAIENFFYFRESSLGDALSSIKCLETTGNNYIIAWQSLITRYNNKKVQVQTHVKRYVNIYAFFLFFNYILSFIISYYCIAKQAFDIIYFTLFIIIIVPNRQFIIYCIYIFYLLCCTKVPILILSHLYSHTGNYCISYLNKLTATNYHYIPFYYFI